MQILSPPASRIKPCEQSQHLDRAMVSRTRSHLSQRAHARERKKEIVVAIMIMVAIVKIHHYGTMDNGHEDRGGNVDADDDDGDPGKKRRKQ